MALVFSNSLMPRNGDQFFPFRQHSDFFYLAGIPQEGSTLAVTRGGAVLFLRKPDEKSALWSGPFLSAAEAEELSGIGDIRPADELNSYLAGEITNFRALYMNHDPHSAREPIRDRGARMWEQLSGTYPRLEMKPLGPILAGLRMVKEKEEIDGIRRACKVAGEGLGQVLAFLRPGVMEYEVEARLTATFTGRGCQGHAFEPIVASGENALILHYVRNAHPCQAGDMVLIDFGPEMNCYGADCTRTLPVSGRFSPRQREVYDAVYRLFLKTRSMMVPGITTTELHREVGMLMEEEHILLGLYTKEDARSRPADDPLWKRYFMHGVSHSLGLDVHDPLDKKEPLRPGMVLACEPAIYIREEGMGIRLENDILITENGPMDLMEDLPMSAGEIESIMEQNAAGK